MFKCLALLNVLASIEDRSKRLTFAINFEMPFTPREQLTITALGGVNAVTIELLTWSHDQQQFNMTCKGYDLRPLGSLYSEKEVEAMFPAWRRVHDSI